MDPFNEKLANLAVNYSLKVQPGQTVAIQSPSVAEDLVLALYQEILKAGGFPMVNIGLPGQRELFYRLANDEQLKYIPEPLKIIYNTYDHIISVNASVNTRELEQIDPKKMQIENSNPEKAELMKTFLTRIGTKEIHWILVPYPCHALAQDAGFGKIAYQEFITKALRLDHEDPIAYWQSIHDVQEHLVDYLNQVDQIQVVGEDTELTLSVKGRKWINCAGELNLPDGEVFTGPIESTVNGCIRFTYPGIFQGKEIENIYLEFKDGKVVKATADKGQELLNSILEIEGADGVGEFAIGTNYNITKFTKNMLFDEKIGGTMHMALGMGIPESGSLAESAIHWDILKDMKSEGSRILADGKVIYQAGKWLI